MTRGLPSSERMCTSSARRQPRVRFALLLCLPATLAAALLAQAQPSDEAEAETSQAVRFAAVDIFIDSADTPLAAYQVELIAKRGEVKIVGVEGGEHAAFTKPPYYDPKALHNEGRIILAAFNTSQDLPTGRTRVARVHVQIRGEEPPQCEIQLVVAASSAGDEIDANASCSERD